MSQEQSAVLVAPQCEQCDQQQFGNIGGFTRHMKSQRHLQGKERPYAVTCKFCGQNFDAASGLASHEKAHHAAQLDALHQRVQDEATKQPRVQKTAPWPSHAEMIAMGSSGPHTNWCQELVKSGQFPTATRTDQTPGKEWWMQCLRSMRQSILDRGIPHKEGHASQTKKERRAEIIQMQQLLAMWQQDGEAARQRADADNNNKSKRQKRDRHTEVDGSSEPAPAASPTTTLGIRQRTTSAGLLGGAIAPSTLLIMVNEDSADCSVAKETMKVAKQRQQAVSQLGGLESPNEGTAHLGAAHHVE